jgi:hypothetical protein
MEKTKLDQTTYGKAYEYACLTSIYNKSKGIRPVAIKDNSSLAVAKKAWDSLDETTKSTMSKSAQAGVDTLLKMEPKILEDGTDTLELSLQRDSKGQEGDVRDVLIIRRDIKWEIGISVKHNHSAVKHSRLSPTIDFGKEWLGLPCSADYFKEIEPVFEELRSLMIKGLKWNEVMEKNSTVYIPLLNAFKRELKRLSEEHGPEVPKKLLEYLLGRKDFYKIISNDSRRFTMLQCFNLHGTLNTPSKSEKPSLKVRGVNMPSLIYHLDFKNKNGVISETTLQLVMDNDWGVSFRIHNASTMVEASLKFDIQLTGVPSGMFSNSVEW